MVFGIRHKIKKVLERTGRVRVVNQSNIETAQQKRTNFRSSDTLLLAGYNLNFVFIPSIIFHYGKSEPFRRGFYCDDESIKYPYHDSTVSTSMLIGIGLLIGIGPIIICEIAHYCYLLRKKFVFPQRPILCVRQFNVNSLVYVISFYVWCFLFGATFTLAWTDIGKYTIGRQRPHFLGTNGCIPDYGLEPCLPGVLVTNYTCQQTNEEILSDVSLSFPSGHASLSAYAAAFTICYIQARVPRLAYTYLLKHVFQAIVALMAWYCGLSRVSDYKHHWSDVLSGFIMGIVAASFMVKFCCKSFRDPHRHGRFRRMTAHSSYDEVNMTESELETPH